MRRTPTRLIDALRRHGLDREAEQMSSCGDWYMATCPECGSDVKPRQGHCDSRICPACAAARADKIYGQLLDPVLALYRKRPRGWRMRLITLTLRKPALVGESYIRSSVRKLLGHPGTQGAITTVWRSRLKVAGAGMIIGLEVAPGGMVHVHCLYLGPWVDKGDLVSYWKAKTGAYIVDIKMVKPGESMRGAVREVTKYVTKGLASGEPDLAVWALMALKGKRRIREYGTFLGLQSDPDAETKPLRCPCCGYEGPLDQGRALTPEQAELWRLGKLPQGRPTPWLLPDGPMKRIAMAAFYA